MPIYEFKCLECGEYFEILVMKSEESVEMACPKCKSESFERILSSTNYAMGEGAGAGKGASAQTRNCSSGSCTTFTIPGASR
jgi:putative FmdB family regulatory protein